MAVNGNSEFEESGRLENADFAQFPSLANGDENVEESSINLNDEDLEVLTPVSFIVLTNRDEIPQAAKSLSIRGASADAIKDYLKQIGQVQLLTAESEIALAKRIETGLIAKNELESNSKMPREEQRNLILIMKDGIRAETALIESNLRLVVSIAKSYTNRGLAFLDLIQEGNLGLIRAVEKFDYKLGNRFSTYATWWIRQNITRAIADHGRTIRIPVHVTELLNKIYTTQKAFLNSQGYLPSDEEIADELEITVEKLLQTKRFGLDALSLSEIVHDGYDFNELAETLVDNAHLSPEQQADESHFHNALEYVLDSVHPRESAIIRARFGLDGGEPRTLDEIGAEFGVTRERIRQIESKAMSKLRHPSRSQILRDFLED